MLVSVCVTNPGVPIAAASSARVIDKLILRCAIIAVPGQLKYKARGPQLTSVIAKPQCMRCSRCTPGVEFFLLCPMALRMALLFTFLLLMSAWHGSAGPADTVVQICVRSEYLACIMPILPHIQATC